MTDPGQTQARETAFRYRIGFGTWINDLRPEPLPLDQWPSGRFDDLTVDGLLATLDVMAGAGYQYLDVFGLWATSEYPRDVLSAFADPERNRRVEQVLAGARDRDIRLVLPLGVFTWGYDRIIREDPEVRGQDDQGRPHPHAMCGARERAWSYLERLVDAFFDRHEFGAVHLESADLGYCACPECAGRDGSVAYNARLNQRAAEYIKSRHPECLVYVCPINWRPWALGEDGLQRPFTPAEVTSVVALSRRIDLFVDQGHRGRFLRWEDLPALQCAYATSGGLWAYHGCRMDRLSYLLPYPIRAARHLIEHHAHGARGALIYQGPMVNPAVEINSVVAGLTMQDVGRDPLDILREVIETRYRPRVPSAGEELARILVALEEAYFGGWEARRFRDEQGMEMPGEFCLGPLFGTSPDPAAFLLEPYLTADGRRNLRQGLLAALRDLSGLDGQFQDQGRLARMQRAVQVMCQLLATAMAARGERGEY
ncbi:MAG: hypothetical protein WDA75_04330 [Candidatus Latescibacterota bacterium]|jgi:hypothetical protein